MVVMVEPVESDKDLAIKVDPDPEIVAIQVILTHVVQVVHQVSEIVEIVVVMEEHGESVHQMVEMPDLPY